MTLSTDLICKLNMNTSLCLLAAVLFPLTCDDRSAIPHPRYLDEKDQRRRWKRKEECMTVISSSDSTPLGIYVLGEEGFRNVQKRVGWVLTRELWGVSLSHISSEPRKKGRLSKNPLGMTAG